MGYYKDLREQKNTTAEDAKAPAIAPISIVTSTKPNVLTKHWKLVEGVPKKLSAGQLVSGEVTTASANNPAVLAAMLKTLKPNQAFMFGVPPCEKAPLVTASALPNAKPGSIARTADTFKWNNGPGWLLLDYDPPKNGTALSKQELTTALITVVPELKNTPMVVGVSGSSCIVNTATNEEITGVRGQRVYVLVADARDIPRAGKALFDRLWLAGWGYFEVSRSGALLKRTIIDDAVFQTNRLDFAAPPICEPPLQCRRPDPKPLNDKANPLNTATAIPSLNAKEREELAQLQSEEANAYDLLAEVHAARENWIDERMAALADLPEDEREAARQRLNTAVTKKRLFGDFELTHSSGQRVPVGDLIDKPDLWHGERFHDPLEPEYGGSDKRIAYANLKSGGAPYIYSHAHGGTRYRLMRPVETIQLQAGELPTTIPKIMARVQRDCELFERGGLLVRVADGALVLVEKPYLQTYLESAIQFMTFDARSKDWRVTDCPDRVPTRIMAMRGHWGLPKVTGLVGFPVMRPDGTVIDRPGYDEATGLLFVDERIDRPLAQPADREGLKQAVARIWQPFEYFPFADDLSRAVFLAALLTTVCRPTLPTAPAFLVRAFTPGTGKTLQSECLMMLAGAPMSAMPLPEGNPEEIEKRLFAKLLKGEAGAILDNLTGVIDNSALCVFLTSGQPEGRILGKSEAPRIANRTLWVLNGNNVTAGGDTFRRILPVSLDANCEAPESREFTFNPKNVISDRLEAYRADLLTVLLTYQHQGAPVVASGAMGSFEQWERLVRQCVCWLIRENLTPAPMQDPLEVMRLSKAEDPHHQQHVEVLNAWHSFFGERVVRVREIVDLVNAGSFGSTGAQAEFIRVVADIVPPRGGFTGRYFAGWLRRHKGQVVDSLRLDAGDLTHNEPGWRVRCVS